MGFPAATLQIKSLFNHPMELGLYLWRAAVWSERAGHGGNAQCRPPGPNITASHCRTLISWYISLLRGFYTSANSMIQRYTRCTTSGLVKSTTEQDKHSLLKKKEKARGERKKQTKTPSLYITHTHGNTLTPMLEIIWMDGYVDPFRYHVLSSHTRSVGSICLNACFHLWHFIIHTFSYCLMHMFILRYPWFN